MVCGAGVLAFCPGPSSAPPYTIPSALPYQLHPQCCPHLAGLHLALANQPTKRTILSEPSCSVISVTSGRIRFQLSLLTCLATLQACALPWPTSQSSVQLRELHVNARGSAQSARLISQKPPTRTCHSSSWLCSPSHLMGCEQPWHVALLYKSDSLGFRIDFEPATHRVCHGSKLQ